MVDLPGYMTWSSRKLAEGVSEALIAHLDATSVWLRPENATEMSEKHYDEMLADLKEDLG